MLGHFALTSTTATPTQLLIRVQAPHFYAGLVMERDECVDAAPVLKWAIGQSREDIQATFARRGWVAMVIQPHRYPRA